MKNNTSSSIYKKIVKNVQDIHDYVLNFYDVKLEDIFKTLPHWKKDGIETHFTDSSGCICTRWSIFSLRVALLKSENLETKEETYTFEEIMV
jgi:hypothetical protein